MLCAVAVVNVPVQDEDSQRCMMGDLLGVASSERCCVEETETTGRVPLCVVTRRTDDRQAVTHLPGKRFNLFIRLSVSCSSHILFPYTERLSVVIKAEVKIHLANSCSKLQTARIWFIFLPKNQIFLTQLFMAQCVLQCVAVCYCVCYSVLLCVTCPVRILSTALKQLPAAS